MKLRLIKHNNGKYAVQVYRGWILGWARLCWLPCSKTFNFDYMTHWPPSEEDFLSYQEAQTLIKKFTDSQVKKTHRNLKSNDY